MLTANAVCPRILTYRPPRIALSLLCFAAVAQFTTPASWGAFRSLPTAAAVVGITGFMLMIRAWWLFRIRGTAIFPTAITSMLVTDDVYRLTRNPMYLGLIMMILGVGLFAGSIFYVAAAAVFFLIINHAFCPYEEQKLRSEFAESYETYCRQVRRWL